VLLNLIGELLLELGVCSLHLSRQGMNRLLYALRLLLEIENHILLIVLEGFSNCNHLVCKLFRRLSAYLVDSSSLYLHSLLEPVLHQLDKTIHEITTYYYESKAQIPFRILTNFLLNLAFSSSLGFLIIG
jgi:hypothetical protein